MHILIAPNAFKHALDADQVAEAIERGLMASKLMCSCERFPIGDGGNGTCRLIIEKLQGETVELLVSDPLGRPISASFGLVDGGKTAVIEMADASGIHLLREEELNPLHANTYGTGQLVRGALEHGVNEVIIGMGGSATIDGGSGILAALGIRFLDADGREITDLPLGLEKLHEIDRTAVDSRLMNCKLTILCDVVNPLLGIAGAAHVFGPQKGAAPAMVEHLEAILKRYADVVLAETGISLSDLASGGVAGGASAGLKGLLGAELVNGSDYFLSLTGFDKSLERSDWVVTAEGSIDSQTLQGKGPYGVAKRAQHFGIPVIGLAGRIPLDITPELNRCFDVLMAIGNGPESLADALPATSSNLYRVALQIGNLIAKTKPNEPAKSRSC
jgi:glycerate 2-kinase